SNDGLGWEGEFDEDDEFRGTSPVTPLKTRMNRNASSTPRNQHYQQQDVYYQNERGIYPGDDDAIASGTRRSAKDGSQYIQRTQQEDPTIELVEGLRTTQKAKQSLQQQGVTTTSIERPMPFNIGARNNVSPTNRRREQNQEMGPRRSEEYNMQVTSSQRRGMIYNDGAANNGSPASRHTEQHQAPAKHKGTIAAEVPDAAIAIPDSSVSSAFDASTTCLPTATLSAPAI
ncbi:hypothetical protein EC957_011662, partial [Mortierella hygrophila]